MQHDDIETILMKRSPAPKARADLSERIIHAALQGKARAQQSLWQEVLSMFAFPYPTMAAAACLLLGLAIGIQAGDGLSLLQQDWTSFLEINEGDFL